MYSTRRFEALKGDVPPDWGFPRRLEQIPRRVRKVAVPSYSADNVTTDADLDQRVSEAMMQAINRLKANANGEELQAGDDATDVSAVTTKEDTIRNDELTVVEKELSSENIDDVAVPIDQDNNNEENAVLEENASVRSGMDSKVVTPRRKRSVDVPVRRSERLQSRATVSPVTYGGRGTASYLTWINNVSADELSSMTFEEKVACDDPLGEWTYTDVSLLVYRLTVRAALNDDSENVRRLARDALMAEIKNLYETCEALKPVMQRSLLAEERRRMIPAITFLKIKELANGAFDKMKARSVASGNLVDRDTVGNTCAPTVNPIVVQLLIAFMTTNRLDMLTADISGAFLIPRMQPGGIKRHVKFDRYMSGLMVEMYPTLSKYRDSTGCLAFELMKYLYGLPEAAYQFYQHLRSFLLSLGFRESKADKCWFIRGSDASLLHVTVLVDDLMCIGRKPVLVQFATELKRAFKITECWGDHHSYIGLDIMTNRVSTARRQATWETVVSQGGLMKSTMIRFEAELKRYTRSTGAPASTTSFMVRSGEELADPTRYLSLIMTLMYIARMTRADLLFSVTVLSSRCKHPTNGDMLAACRILRYLFDNGTWGVMYKPVQMRWNVFVDSSHKLHDDQRGHIGLVISVGSGYLFASSSKMRLVTLSTKDTEVTASCHAVTYARWCMLAGKDVGIPDVPIKFWNDNMANVCSNDVGPNFSTNKHILVRLEFVRQAKDEGAIVLLHCDTDQLCADMLTKALDETALRRHMRKMGMVCLEAGPRRSTSTARGRNNGLVSMSGGQRK